MPTDPLAWETLDRSVAYTCPGFDIVNETVQLPDGTETDFDYLADDPSVAVLPFTADGEVVLIEEWRQAVDRVSRGLPVGGVESDDEAIAAAARRELAEETGYEAETLEELVTVEPANGISNAVLHLFVARGCRQTADQQLDHDESIRVTTTTLEELVTAIGDGEVRDGRTVLGVSYYRLFDDDRTDEES
ncbi:NUDIX hydrolase [Natrialbaceae archaeon AArc-T1-2]|uniref:NUDIX hydrolase n=1 Tax=Natrialbaceae archaeon AArc-T1-2 TaxID=3053904 RepID=UPI00255AF87F|nr:NUDIX hydrolase [Natrialbaceae archaeon AArc-T1-2]WIV66818.1 NUDIX hydrolase [Natrialbaceae archaeon AArc-T1-2]